MGSKSHQGCGSSTKGNKPLIIPDLRAGHTNVRPPGAFTIAEAADEWGCSYSTASRTVRDAVKAGSVKFVCTITINSVCAKLYAKV